MTYYLFRGNEGYYWTSEKGEGGGVKNVQMMSFMDVPSSQMLKFQFRDNILILTCDRYEL